MSNQEFWLNYLDNPTLSVLPHDFLKPANNQSVEASYSFDVSDDKTKDFPFGLAVFGALIYKLTGDEDTVVSTDTESNYKEFIVRMNLIPSMKFSELLANVQKEYDNNSTKIDYESLNEVAEYIKTSKKLDDYPTLFRLSYQHANPTQQLSTAVQGSVRDLAFFGPGKDGKFSIYYNSLLYKYDRIVILAEQFQKFLGAVSARLQFNTYLGTLAEYGYDVSIDDYPTWRSALERFVVQDSKDSALFPLLHFVLDNLPQNTKAPELDDSNASKALKSDEKWTGVDVSGGKGIDVKQMGVYISYLVKVGFLPAPTKKGLPLPEVDISDETVNLITAGAGGRGSAAK